jgi:UDP-glucose 4-epimerase
VPIAESAPTDPICAYGVHKLAIEKYLHLWRHLHKLDSVVLRTANPYGERQRHDSGQGAIPAFIARALRSQPLQVWGDGSVVRDYLHISDVARALVMAGCTPRASGVFNIGSGTGHSLNEIVQSLERVLGRRIAVEHQGARAFDVPVSVLDVSLAAHELGWKPQVGLEEGLRRTVAWMQAQPGLSAPGAGQKMLSPT